MYFPCIVHYRVPYMLWKMLYWSVLLSFKNYFLLSQHDVYFSAVGLFCFLSHKILFRLWLKHDLTTFLRIISVALFATSVFHASSVILIFVFYRVLFLLQLMHINFRSLNFKQMSFQDYLVFKICSSIGNDSLKLNLYLFFVFPAFNFSEFHYIRHRLSIIFVEFLT